MAVPDVKPFHDGGAQMYRLAWLLIPAVASCSPLRYARLGEVEGKVQTQIHAADSWQVAARNTPLVESARVQTDSQAHAEIELDEGSVVRLTPETLLELSDYTRLSSGQRVTLLSLDHGIAYFTGQARRQDALLLAVPGAQVTVQRGSRVRIEARDAWSQIAVLEGKVRFSSPSAEMDLAEGEMARVDPSNRTKFYLYREISSYDSDRWNEERDKLLASATSSAHVPDLHYGVQDLDSGGTWIEMENFGTVWKPKVQDGWAPFRDGRWAWYDSLGYTWIGNDPWGWLPYHYGRWMRTADTGWFWVPGRSQVFKPGEVYWLRGSTVAGWGPLAPSEEWGPGLMPQLFLNSSTTWAQFAQDVRQIDPAGFTARPKEPLAAASFTLALPSPALVAARLDAIRPPLRTGATRILPVISGVAYEDTTAMAAAPLPPAPAPPPDPGPPAGSAPPVIVTVPPPDLPVEIYYPVPVYTGVVVMNPPQKATNSGGGSGGHATDSGNSAHSNRALHDAPKPPHQGQASPPTEPRAEPPREHHVPEPPHTIAHPSPPPVREPKPNAPVPRQESSRTLAAPSVAQPKEVNSSSANKSDSKK